MKDLLITGGTWHDWAGFAEYVRPMLREPAVNAIDALGELPAGGRIVLFTCNEVQHQSAALGAAYGRLASWVGAGGRLLALHSTLCAAQWHEGFAAVLGTRFKWHPPQCPVSFFTTDPALQPREWATVDEFYHLEAEPQAPILAWHDDGSGPRPVLWRKPHGNGRVTVFTPGHDEKVWRTEGYTGWLREAIESLEL